MNKATWLGTETNHDLWSGCSGDASFLKSKIIPKGCAELEIKCELNCPNTRLRRE